MQTINIELFLGVIELDNTIRIFFINNYDFFNTIFNRSIRGIRINEAVIIKSLKSNI